MKITTAHLPAKATFAAALLLALSACAPDRDTPEEVMTQGDVPEEEAAPMPEEPAQPEPAPAPKPAAPKAPAPKPQTSTAAPASTSTQAPEPAVTCSNCGTVASVTAEQVKAQGSGAGAAVGAVVGGVLGHQVGGGSGKKLATVAGAIGGAVAGNEVEKRSRASTQYRIGINMDNGSWQEIIVPDATGLYQGAKVRVEGSTIVLR